MGLRLPGASAEIYSGSGPFKGAMRFLQWLSIAFMVGGFLRAAEMPEILAGLRPEHPRLILTADDWKRLRAGQGGKGDVAAILTICMKEAVAMLDEPPVVYKKEGKRLLAVSREALKRIELWSFAYRITGEKRFLDRAEKEMLTVAAFADWNPSHFLDTAEMTAALALGYDWLFADLSPATRDTVRKAIIEKGLKPGIRLEGRGWQVQTMNWNQVCFGGLGLGALAIADEAPAEASALLGQIRKYNHYGMEPYAPDGIYPEGPGYFNYGTGYEVLLISALESALGTEWHLPSSPGFLAAAAAQMQLTGPTGWPFNFSDNHTTGPIYQPWQFWFARRLNQPSLVHFQQQRLRESIMAGKYDNAFPWLAKWLNDMPAGSPNPDLPLAWHGNGENPVGVFRTSWSDPDALYLAFKGGQANNSHGHMDAGSFVLDAGGVRWASDLGSQSYYSIESQGWGLWDSSQSGERWRVYRLNNHSHNTLTLGGQLHQSAGRAEITSFGTNNATVDLSPVFKPQARSVIRHFSFQPDKVDIRDEIAGAAKGLDVRWQMLTRADIDLTRNEAVLRQDGKILRARIVAPTDARFEKAAAEPPTDGVNEPNPGFALLQVNTKVPESGDISIEIELQPDPAPAAK